MRRPHSEVIAAVTRALELYREAIGPDTLAWTPDGEGYWQKLDEETWKLTYEEMLHPRGAYIFLRETDRLVSDYEFRYRGEDFGYVLDG